MAKEITLDVSTTIRLIQLLKCGADYASDKGAAMYEESKAPYSSDLYDDDDFAHIDEAMQDMERLAKELERKLYNGEG